MASNFFPLKFALILTEVVDMNNKDEVLQPISIGLIVAYFLFNTNRALKSIEVCKECLTIFKERAGIIDDKIAKSLYKRVYLIMSNAYRAIKDNTNAILYTEKVLQIYRKSGEKLAEYALSFDLANIYFCQSKYADTRELYERAQEIGGRNGERECYANLGTVYSKSVGEYDKAREHLEKSLAISKEIGDRNGEDHCYRTLQRFTSVKVNMQKRENSWRERY